MGSLFIGSLPSFVTANTTKAKCIIEHKYKTWGCTVKSINYIKDNKIYSDTFPVNDYFSLRINKSKSTFNQLFFMNLVNTLFGKEIDTEQCSLITRGKNNNKLYFNCQYSDSFLKRLSSLYLQVNFASFSIRIPMTEMFQCDTSNCNSLFKSKPKYHSEDQWVLARPIM